MSISIGDIISELRMDKGLKQTELASLLGVGQTTISGYENNTILPDADKLIKLADTFNVSVDYLLCRIRYNFDLKSLDNNFGEIDGKPITVGDLLSNFNQYRIKKFTVRLLKTSNNKRNIRQKITAITIIM